MDEKSEHKSDRLKKLVGGFPQDPGVYIMKNQTDRIIYVGKAKRLRARVLSYFNGNSTPSKTKFLVSQINDVSYIITKTEVEAFLLEASLIKKHRPKYNIRLKDDKAYPYIRISMSDEFPRLYLARNVKKDGSIYFGPYTVGRYVNQIIKFLNQTFFIRDCSDHFMKSRTRPCLTHQIGRCKAPCVGLVNKEEYAKDIKRGILFLRGKNKTITKDLEAEMKQAAKKEEFERASAIRDSLFAIDQILEKQTVVSINVEMDQDAVSFHGDERGCSVETVHVRQGRVIGSRHHFLPQVNILSSEEDPRDWFVSFLNQYYEDNIIPDEILIPIDLGHDITELLMNVLKERSGKSVKIRYPNDLVGAKLVEMAERNVKQHFQDHVLKSESKIQALEEIKLKFQLEKLPLRIECYDISHFQGKETVASQVVFEEGVPSTDQYRRYKLNTIDGINDYKSLKEVLTRRLKHTEYDEPKLILIDGGKGQLNIIVEVLKEMGRSELPVVSIAKARTESDFQGGEVKRTEERFFLPGRSNPVIFKNNSEALKILVNLRDEAHRFAITYHRKLREATTLESALDRIHGLGPKKKTELLKTYPSIEAIKSSSLDDLIKIKGISENLARQILDSLEEEIQQDTNPGFKTD